VDENGVGPAVRDGGKRDTIPLTSEGKNPPNAAGNNGEKKNFNNALKGDRLDKKKSRVGHETGLDGKGEEKETCQSSRELGVKRISKLLLTLSPEPKKK